MKHSPKTLAERARQCDEIRLILAEMNISQSLLARLYCIQKQAVSATFRGERRLPDECLETHSLFLNIAEQTQAMRLQERRFKRLLADHNLTMPEGMEIYA